MGSARRPRADWYEIWVRDGPLRLLYGSSQRRRGSFLRHSCGARRRENCNYDRRTLARSEPPGAAGLAGDTGPAMRLLPAWTDDVRGLFAGAESEPDRLGYGRRDERQSLPLRDLPAHPQGDPSRGGDRY